MRSRRRFAIRTFGCQMNVHDSEKLANLLFHDGYEPAEDLEQADLLLVNTCSIRDKAEHRLYSDLGALRAWKLAGPDRVLAVAGCVAQQEGAGLLARFEHLDFVVGTHQLRLVPTLARQALAGKRGARVEESASLDRFDLPERHPGYQGTSPGRAYLTVMEGCDMFCSFCIVPRTRGREISRPARAVVDEARSLVARGVRELVLLGQTVNAYGRHDARRARSELAGTLRFADLLRELAAIPGLDRLRYTSPHPLFFDDPLIAAHGELEALCPHVHLPLQSGSDSVLARMHRRHGVAEFLDLVRRLRAARPDLAVTTDLIVGFPGETPADFEATLAAMRQADFVDSYSFKYSPRPGTRAAELPGRVEPGEAQERLVELQTLQRRLTAVHHQRRVGGDTEVLLEGPSRRGDSVQGRDPQHRVVHVADCTADPGTLVPVRIVAATPHSLLAQPRTSRERVKPTPLLADEQGRARSLAGAV